MKKLSTILLGIVSTSIGVLFLKHAMIASGGTAGLALSVSYLFGMSFSQLFFLINIPFYIFAFVQFGWRFTLSTLGSVTLLSFLTSLDRFLPAFSLPLWFGALGGGLLIDFGLSRLFMNGSSLGGLNILSLFLQKRYQIDPGKSNFAFDLAVILTSFYAVGLVRGLFSILTIAIASRVISYYKNEIAGRNQATPAEQAQSVSEKCLPRKAQKLSVAGS